VNTGVSAVGVSTEAGRVTTVQTSAGEFRPAHVVFATGLPPRLDGLTLDVPASEVKGHMLASNPTSMAPPEVVADIAKVIEDGRLLVGGSLDLGDDERVVRDEVVDRMWAEMVALWPAARDIGVGYRWACFRPAHADHLPVIDRVPSLSNAWLTSGHYKTGILNAAATGRALATWMRTGERPPEVAPFSVDRLLEPAR
jgi:glycine oxidase